MVQGHHEGGGASVPTIAIQAVTALANPREKTGMLGRWQQPPLRLIKKRGKERSKKIGGDSRSQMLTHISQPPLLCPPLLSVARKKKSLCRRDFLEMAGITEGEQQWFRKVHFFFFSINIVKKMQTLTKLFSLEGKWEEEGEFGKEPKFLQVLYSSIVFLFFLSPPIVAKSWSSCFICAPVGGWRSGYEVKVYDYKSLFSNFHMLLKKEAGQKQNKRLA